MLKKRKARAPETLQETKAQLAIKPLALAKKEPTRPQPRKNRSWAWIQTTITIKAKYLLKR